ncbi:DUF4919 domain-containing protein [Sphingobacterium sp. DK4209]|uniref:DUF4919 domain-containing protein n=2 Tax=Sphingobacterium zhuxiongii TaxID=2662364 RepID=A0A5Q0QCF7_9SPHI|nr:DUF4919 domain-containing protein [Sphingobacterium sp. DK4209]QGA26551.1 DUF4919 domain-containing protein [Sphingobacterium sp. dk4302]
MIMKMKLILTLFIAVQLLIANAQDSTKITIPNFQDKYSEYVTKLEAGDTDIDYQDFRFSFIESEQFILATKQIVLQNQLKTEMYQEYHNENYQEAMKLAKQILSFDYTSLDAHKILRHCYQDQDDKDNFEKYLNIQLGLFQSIITSGDGRSCATGWKVIQVSEEYFVLHILKANKEKQSLVTEGGLCDQLDVVMEDGTKRTFYFDVSKVFEGYKKLKM